MEGKDDRSKSKRSKMKQHNYRKATKNSIAVGNTSSSSQREHVRGVIDVADSSDERFAGRNGWMRPNMGGIAPQPLPRSNLDDELDDLENVDNEQLHAPDFEQIAQLPMSAGGHFRFASEKSWDLAENEQLLDHTEASKYFTLNLKLLNVGLQTIPFYKRLDYPSSMFSNNQIKEMEKKAEAAEAQYQKILQEHNEKTPTEKEVNNATKEMERVAIEDETAAAKENTTLPVPVTEEAKDIQDWLDNVLEE